MRVVTPMPLLTVILLTTVLASFLCPRANAQVTISGIVVDSITFNSIPYAHIGIKGKEGGTVTDKEGRFSLQLKAFDTLLITAVGYVSLTFPALFDQEDILILMKEDVTFLREVTVFGNPIRSPLIKEKPELVIRRPPPARLATSSGIAFDYFSRAQRERRKLQRLISANERVQAYNSIITDPDFKARIQDKYNITDERYYEGVLSFNLNNLDMIYDKTEAEVLTIMDNYFCRISNQCR